MKLSKKAVPFSIKEILGLIGIHCLFLSTYTFASVTVTPATGGASLCTSYVTLGNIVITENVNSDILANQSGATLILTAPSGYEFKSPGTATVTKGGTSPGTADLTAVSISVSTTAITITLSTDASAGIIDVITIIGVEVKATNASPEAVSGNILRNGGNPGSANLFGITNDVTNFGTLTQTNMEYISSTVTQSNTNNINQGTNDNELLRIEIITVDSCAPLEVSNFLLNTLGSSDPSSDLLNSKIYYTGTSSTFATDNLFGTRAFPQGSYSISGTAALLPGVNYFWLTYDIPATATTSSLVDGECIGINVGGSNRTPDITAPVGSRTIGITTINSSGAGGVWNDVDTWAGGIIPDSNYHVNIVSGDIISMANSQSCGNIHLNGLAVLSIGANTLTVSGNIIVDSPGNFKTTSNTELIINDMGGKPQLTMPVGVNFLKKLTINRATGVTCAIDLNLGSTPPADSIVLVLKKGILTMSNSSKLLLDNPAVKPDIPSSDISYVDGIVSRVIANNGSFYVYPLGDNGFSRPYAVAQTSGTIGAPQEIEFFYEIPANYCCVNNATLPGSIMDKYFWKWSGSGNVMRRIYYNDSDFSGFNATDRLNVLTLATNPGSTSTDEWTKVTVPLTVFDDPDKKYIQFISSSTSINTFWTIGSTDAAKSFPKFQTAVPVSIKDTIPFPDAYTTVHFLNLDSTLSPDSSQIAITFYPSKYYFPDSSSFPDTLATLFKYAHWKISSLNPDFSAEICFTFDSNRFNTTFLQYLNCFYKEENNSLWNVIDTVPYLSGNRICFITNHFSNWALGITKAEALIKIDTSLLNATGNTNWFEYKKPESGIMLELKLPADSISKININRYGINPGGEIPSNFSKLLNQYWEIKKTNHEQSTLTLDPALITGYDSNESKNYHILYRQDAISPWEELSTSRVKKAMKVTLTSSVITTSGNYIVGLSDDTTSVFGLEVTVNPFCKGDTAVFVPALTGGTPPYEYSWSGDDNFSSNIQTPSHVYNSDGQYFYELTLRDSLGITTSFADTVTVNCTGENFIPIPSPLIIFPNPGNRLNIYSGSGTKKIREIKLINMQGVIVYENNNITEERSQIALQTPNNGMYILEVRYQDGVEFRKVVLQ